MQLAADRMVRESQAGLKVPTLQTVAPTMESSRTGVNKYIVRVPRRTPLIETEWHRQLQSEGGNDRRKRNNSTIEEESKSNSGIRGVAI